MDVGDSLRCSGLQVGLTVHCFSCKLQSQGRQHDPRSQCQVRVLMRPCGRVFQLKLYRDALQGSTHVRRCLQYSSSVSRRIEFKRPSESVYVMAPSGFSGQIVACSTRKVLEILWSLVAPQPMRTGKALFHTVQPSDLSLILPALLRRYDGSP
jgi:hypothetical protein